MDTNREIEVRFLEIDKDALVKKLKELGAQDLEEDFLREIIFYDKKLTWQYPKGRKLVRVRKTKRGIFMTFKDHKEFSPTGTKEIELKIDSFEKAAQFLEEVGLIAFRKQQKKRHTFKLDDVTIDIDTWPSVPTYVELEGHSEKALKNVAKLLNLNWKNAIFEPPGAIIEKRYHIPVSKLTYFTFNKIE